MKFRTKLNSPAGLFYGWRMVALGCAVRILGGGLYRYLEAGNITECFVAGKIAGKNAAAEKPWS